MLVFISTDNGGVQSSGGRVWIGLNHRNFFRQRWTFFTKEPYNSISTVMKKGGTVEYKDIIYTKEGHIATITLNRPERMNAFTLTMINSIGQALQDANEDEQIRVIVDITGAGRGFSAGPDLKEPPDFRGRSTTGAAVRTPQLPGVFMSIDKPIVASINGAAIGWGLELALLCDIRIAAENAPLGDRHLNFFHHRRPWCAVYHATYRWLG